MATPRYHDIRIEDRKIFYARNDRTVQHCVAGDALRVAWDSEWEYMTDVVANFINQADGARKLMDLSGGTCMIPWEVMQTTGYLHVSIWGYIDDEKRVVTQKMERPFYVLESGDVYDSLIPEATYDILQKILDGAHDIDTAIANALIIAREAQGIIDSIRSLGFDADTLFTAIDTLARRLTKAYGDVWAVGTVLYASGDIAHWVASSSDDPHGATLIVASAVGETGIKIGD